MTKWTRETPWRQGYLLTDEAVKSLGLLQLEFKENTLVVVATHDCDLAQAPDREPHIEVIVGRRIESLDGNCTHAKSARTLHMQYEGDEPLLAEFVNTAKHSILKKDLLNFKPVSSVKLSPQNLAIFQQWLASRYRRSAFPDEFERRLVNETKLAEKISKAVKPHGEFITAVFFDVDEGKDIVHEKPDDSYLLDIILLHSAGSDFNLAESAAIKAKGAIEKAFREKLYNHSNGWWQWIELRYVDAISEEALTYKQSTLLKKWRLDHISLASEPQQRMLKEQ